MAKSDLKRAVERQVRTVQKSANEIKAQAIAQEVVAGAMFVGGFRVMDKDSEALLQAILEQYNGNTDNYVDFDTDSLPRYLKEALTIGYEKLKMYGMISDILNWFNRSGITLSESGKIYFDEKEKAIEREEQTTLDKNNTYINNFYRDANNVQIQQGTRKSSQEQIINEGLDYEKIEGVIGKIKKYEDSFDDEYGKYAAEMRDALNETEELVKKKENPGRIKTLIDFMKTLSMNITGSIIASGIFAWLCEIGG